MLDVKEVANRIYRFETGISVMTSLFTVYLIKEALEKVQVLPAGKAIRLWNTGQSWKLFDLGMESVERYGFPYITIHRGDLHGVIARALLREKPDAVHLNRRCVGLTQTSDHAELRFEIGEPVRAKVVVGADGVHSVVRASLFGAPKPQFCGIIAWRGVVPMERVPASISRTVGTNWVGPGGHVVHYPLRAGKLLNFVGMGERRDWTVEGWNVRGTTDEVLNDFRGWHPDVHALIRNVDVPYKWALALRPTMDAWSKGRCTLLGDACHPMVPFLAQGAVMALEDGLVLARALEKYPTDHETALAAYEGARRVRANKVVSGSADMIPRFHNHAMADAEQFMGVLKDSHLGGNSQYEFEAFLMVCNRLMHLDFVVAAVIVAAPMTHKAFLGADPLQYPCPQKVPGAHVKHGVLDRRTSTVNDVDFHRHPFTLAPEWR
jgi:salicylate hydroxylase